MKAVPVRSLDIEVPLTTSPAQPARPA
jgi:hypothetical protein